MTKCTPMPVRFSFTVVTPPRSISLRMGLEPKNHLVYLRRSLQPSFSNTVQTYRVEPTQGIKPCFHPYQGSVIISILCRRKRRLSLSGDQPYPVVNPFCGQQFFSDYNRSEPVVWRKLNFWLSDQDLNLGTNAIGVCSPH